MSKSPIPTDSLEAMIVALVAVEEFSELPLAAMTPEQRAAVCLLFAGMMARVVDKLPRTEATAYMFPIMEHAFELARHSRELLHLDVERRFPADLTQTKQ